MGEDVVVDGFDEVEIEEERVDMVSVIILARELRS